MWYCLELVTKQIYGFKTCNEYKQILFKNSLGNILTDLTTHTCAQKTEKILNAARENILIIFKEVTVIN